MAEIAERSFLVKVDGLDGLFSQSDGNVLTATVSQVWNGGDPIPARVASPPTPANLTLTKPFKPERDSAIIAQLRPLVGNWYTTVSQQPTDANFTPVGSARNAISALLIELREPNANAGSGAGAMWGLVFAPSSVTS